MSLVDLPTRFYYLKAESFIHCTLLSSGQGINGRLGHGNKANLSEPKLISSMQTFYIHQIACGRAHSLAIGSIRDSDGILKPSSDAIPTASNHKFVFSWGSGESGRLGHNNTDDINAPTMIKSLSGYDVLSVCCGDMHSVVLCESGMYSFGSNDGGQLGTGDKDIRMEPYKIEIGVPVKKIVCGALHTAALSESGDIYCWGASNKGQLGVGKIVESYLSPEKINLDYLVANIYAGPSYTLIETGDTKPISVVPKEEMNISIEENKKTESKHDRSIDEPISIISRQNKPLLDSEKKVRQNQSMTSAPQNMDEVESLMQFIKISGIGLDISKIPDDISFRPKNLNPKTKEEQEKHRRLIEENRAMYIQKLKKKEKEMKDRMLKEREKENRESELKSIWEKEILPNWNQIKGAKKVISLWREGIPSSVREKVWMLSLGNQNFITQDLFIINARKAKKLRELQNLQLSLNLKISEMKNKGLPEEEIMKAEAENKKLQERLFEVYSPENKEYSIEGIQVDLPRTFPELGFFKQGSGFNMDCEEILGAYALSRPDIGYVQGMSYIAGMLILNMDKFKAFVCFNKIITSWTLFCFFKADSAQMNRRFQLFRNILHHNCSELCEHIEDEGITAQMYLLEWFMTLFVKSLNIDVSSRIWDLFILEGEIVLFRVAVALLRLSQHEIMHGNFEEIISCIKSMSSKVKDADMLIKELYDIEIPTWVIEEVPKIINEYIPK